MTKAVLLSSDTLARAKKSVAPLAAAFLKTEPGNTMVIPETRQGAAVIAKAIDSLEAMGYSPEDATMLFSETVQMLDNNPAVFGNLSEAVDAAAPATPPKPSNNDF